MSTTVNRGNEGFTIKGGGRDRGEFLVEKARNNEMPCGKDRDLSKHGSTKMKPRDKT